MNKINLEISSMERKLTDLKILKMRLQAIAEKQKQLDEILKSNNFLEKDLEMLKKQIEILKQSILEMSKFDTLFEQKLSLLKDSTSFLTE